MLQKFVEKILSLDAIRQEKIGDHIYTKDGLSIVHPPQHSKPAVLGFKTLQGLADYMNSQIDPERVEDSKLFVHVFDFDKVFIYGNIDPMNENIRFKYCEAGLDATAFKFDQFHDLERFIIALQSLFVYDEVIGGMIDMLGKLANETVVENKDDKFSQTIQVTTGITTRSKVKVENPLTLRPYRTFREIEQPSSQFILRLRNQGGINCSLYEADGGAWKLAAIANIKKWLSEKIPQSTVIG